MPGQFAGYTLPAPNGGLNVIDSIDALPAMDAQELVNLYPVGQRTEVRKGYTQFCAAATSSPAWSLYNLPLADSTTQLIRASNNKLWRVDSGSESDITSTATITDSKWNSCVFSHKRYFTNGVDTPLAWDGTTLSALTFTGVTLTDLINVSAYRERLYFVEKNSASFWYGGTKVVGTSATPALTEFDVSYYLTLGGRLLFAGSLGSKRGNSPQNLFVAVSSEGEVLFYSGSYPGDSAWTLVDHYTIGKPLGYRAFVRVNSDLWVITEQGLVSLSALLGGGELAGALDIIGKKINPIISDYADSVGFHHLWSGTHWPQGRRVYISVPTAGNNTILLVRNTDTGAWCTYEYYGAGVALSMALMGGLPYIGGVDGKVYKAEDNQNDAGEAIAFRARLAPSFFGNRGQFKVFKDIRPLMRAPRGITLSLAIDTDFSESESVGTISTGTGTGSAWDEDAWDVATWASDAEYLFDRYGLKGQGHSGAIRVSGSVKNAPLEFNGFEVRYELGGQV